MCLELRRIVWRWSYDADNSGIIFILKYIQIENIILKCQNINLFLI